MKASSKVKCFPEHYITIIQQYIHTIWPHPHSFGGICTCFDIKNLTCTRHGANTFIAPLFFWSSHWCCLFWAKFFLISFFLSFLISSLSGRAVSSLVISWHIPNVFLVCLRAVGYRSYTIDHLVCIITFMVMNINCLLIIVICKYCWTKCL